MSRKHTRLRRLRLIHAVEATMAAKRQGGDIDFQRMFSLADDYIIRVSTRVERRLFDMESEHHLRSPCECSYCRNKRAGEQ